MGEWVDISCLSIPIDLLWDSSSPLDKTYGILLFTQSWVCEKVNLWTEILEESEIILAAIGNDVSNS